LVEQVQRGRTEQQDLYRQGDIVPTLDDPGRLGQALGLVDD